MVDEAGANIETLHRNEYSLGASTGELHILVRQAQVAAAADALALEPPYRFRVTLALVEPSLAEVRQFGSLPRELRERDRKSVVEGKSVSVRVDLGGPRS